MAKQNSFDIVSEVDLAEVKNAVIQASKEVGQRYDLKDSQSEIELNEKDHQLVLHSKDDYTLAAVDDILQSKLHRRGVSLKALTHGTIEPAAKSNVRQTIDLQQGIPGDKAKEIVKLIKTWKLKVQASINDDLVRVTSKDRDTLQEVMAKLKAEDLGIDMQFTNYR
ncbi:MAG: YajQ family cyclic di-GMP-binding protein [Thermoanaerobaculia bacterium]|nr:YajQ family cyclic di-GMP-binding protein [Thermoanaerobaculia bacterium]